MPEALVLDNVVLSAFHRVGWLDCLEHWSDDYDLLTPVRVWQLEFVSTNKIEEPPEWLETYPIQSQIEPESPGQLSDNDWRCVAAAEERNGLLVTRDRKLRARAGERGIEVMWLGRFVIETYESCGISVPSYRENLDSYFEDSYEPEEVRETIRNAEKQ